MEDRIEAACWYCTLRRAGKAAIDPGYFHSWGWLPLIISRHPIPHCTGDMMKLFCAVVITTFFSVWAASQPVEFVKGDAVAVVMGSGTDMKPGTKLRGTVTRSDEEGLGFRVVKHGTYWVKWSHILSVNGKRLAKATPADALQTESSPSSEPPQDPSIDAAPAYTPPTHTLVGPDQTGSSASDSFDRDSHGYRNEDTIPVSRGYSRRTSRLDDESGRGWKYAASLDYFGVGNAASKGQLSSLTSNVCAIVIADGATSCTASASANGAVGFRVGFWKPAEEFDWGASCGYLYGGPSGSGKLTVTTVPAGSGTATQSDNTVRLMGEVRKSIPLSDLWSLRMGAGLGMAEDFWNASCSSSGTGANCASLGLPAQESGSQGWITWELSPSIAYGRWSVGFRYAGFGRTGATPWNTFGGFFGAEF